MRVYRKTFKDRREQSRNEIIWLPHQRERFSRAQKFIKRGYLTLAINTLSFNLRGHCHKEILKAKELLHLGHTSAAISSIAKITGRSSGCSHRRCSDSCWNTLAALTQKYEIADC